jgi:cardiolipin synthase
MLRHLPNLVTALRMLLVVPLCGLIQGGRFEAALVVAAVAAASDALDGFLAKRFGWTSRLGGLLDPVADKLLLMAAFVGLALVDGVPAWLAGLVVGRDLAIVAGAVAYHNLIGPFDAAPSAVSKATTAMQIGFVLLVLVALAAGVDLPRWLRAILVAATAALTAVSGLHYIVVWSRRARQALRARKGER